MKLSIITINYNNVIGLEKTIDSIVDQNFSDFEYIVIDGASTDGSIDILKKYSEKIDYWISEPDSGIYNAMNKGIRQAKGEYILFINSGDIIENGIDLVKFFSYLSGEDFIYFNLKIVYPDYSEIKSYETKLSFEYFLKESLPHPATFIKRQLFIKYGFYNENLKICSDWAFFMDMISVRKCSYKKINEYFSVFFFDGISSNQNNQKIIQNEQKYYIKNILSAYYTYYRIYLIRKAQIYKWGRKLKQSLRKPFK